MSSPRAEFFPSVRASRAVRWLLPTALLALTPKCLLCIAAYAGLGAALGLGRQEMCGAPAGFALSWASSLAWLGGVAGASALVAGVRCACGFERPTHPVASRHP